MINFYLGEEKYINAKVVPKNNDDIIIVNSAEYTLTDTNGNVVDSGTCEIDGINLIMLLSPDGVGTYKLKITARVGAETIIEKSHISVKE